MPWQGISLVVDLLQGLLGCAVVLEFHDIDVLVGFQDEVYAAVAGLVFGFDVEAAEGCDDEDDILEPILGILCMKPSALPDSMSETNLLISNAEFVIFFVV